MKYEKYYTQKEWSRFNRCFEKEINGQKYHRCTQEVLINKYDIVITDYQTKKEKILNVIKKVNIQNVNRFLDMIKPAAKIKQSRKKSKSYSYKTPKIKEIDYSFLVSQPIQKAKKRRSRKKTVKKTGIDYSFLTGKR